VSKGSNGAGNPRMVMPKKVREGKEKREKRDL